MISLTRTHTVIAAIAGALMALTATNATADDLAINLDPVGPHQPILASIGNSRVVAFYTPDAGNCAVQAVVWRDQSGDDAAHVRISLGPRQVLHINSVEHKTLSLQCGERGEQLAVVNTPELIAFGTAE